jgi:hypothetical protein
VENSPKINKFPSQKTSPISPIKISTNPRPLQKKVSSFKKIRENAKEKLLMSNKQKKEILKFIHFLLMNNLFTALQRCKKNNKRGKGVSHNDCFFYKNPK